MKAAYPGNGPINTWCLPLLSLPLLPLFSLLLLLCISTAAAGNSGITVKTPNGGETFRVGDTTHITWDSPRDLNGGGASIELSVDGGITWLFAVKQAITPFDDRWQNLPWTIPDSVGNSPSLVSTVTTTGRIRVRPYTSYSGDISDANFTILPRESSMNVAAQAPAGFRLALAGEALQLTFPQAAARIVSLYDLHGVLLEQVKTPGASVSLSLRPQAGLYVLKVAENGRSPFTQKILVD